MRLVCVGLVLAFGCGSHASGQGDDVPDGGGGDDGGDPCVQDPASCPSDTGNFVSTARGNDANPGTKTMPFKTITAAIAHAKSLGGAQTVYVGQGMYPEKVTLKEGVELDGGYECNANACSWSRDLVAFETTIVNQDYEGVLADAFITNATLISGFTIRGKDGVPAVAPGSVGLTVFGGAPTVRGNKIIGGAVTGGMASAADRSIGIALRSTAGLVAKIENNDITGGAAIGLSAAISFEALSGTPANATVTANQLRGGTARRSDGIAAFGTSPSTIVSDNDILAGNSTNGTSSGIEVTTPMFILRNRINIDASQVGTCTTPTNWCAGITSNGATLVIKNNVVYGPKGTRSAAVFLTESEIPAGVVVLNANYLNGGGIGGTPSGTTGRHDSAAIAVSIGQCNTCGLKGIVGRARNNILDGGINVNRFGVREDPAQGKTARLEALEANDFWFAALLPNRSDVLYRQVTSTGTPIDTKSVFVLNQMTAPPATSNLADDPQIDASWHIATTSACVDSGVSMEAPNDDFDGDPRPHGQGVDIGADETH